MKEIRKRECPLILLLVMIIFSQNVYAFSQLATGYWALARNVVQLIVLLLLAIGILRKDKVDRNVLCIYVIFVANLLVTMFWFMDFAGTYWILDCTIAFLFVELYDEYSIAEKFEKIMFVICCVYTLLYLITVGNWEILKTPICLLMEKMHLIWHHSSVYEYYVSGAASLRSYAIFREPGVYQMFIILALIVEIFVRKKMRWWHAGVYILALLATRSTTGYICLLLVACMVVIKYWKITPVTLLFAGGGLAASIPILPRILSSIAAKFTATGGSSHSWLSRLASVVTNLYFWKESPVIGVGISRIYNDFEVVTREVFGLQAGAYSIKDDTNTILLFFAAFGIVAGFLFVVGMYGFCKKMARTKLLTLILFVTFVCLYAGEAVNSTCYPYILFFIGINGVLGKKEAECVV